MSLADALAGASVKRQPCKLGGYLAQMSDEDRRALEDALAVERGTVGHLGGDALAHALSSNGYPVSRDTVDSHRFGRCACVAR